jgi:hypothetical protein
MMGLLTAFVLFSGAGFAADNHAASLGANATGVTEEPDGDGSRLRLRLITGDQYLNTLAYIFGPDIKLDTHFAPLQRTSGLLENGAASAGVTRGQLEQYQRTAAQVAARVVDPQHRSFLIPCKPASDAAADIACATKFLAVTARLLYRQHLSDAKVKQLAEAAGLAADRLKDFYAGLSIALEGMLISPDVLFVAETSEPDPAHPGRSRLDSYSLASRLSFFLWNAGPDELLLKSAQNGELETKRGRARVVDMMLESPRLETGVRAFFDDMFGFDDFNTLAKDAQVYPSFTGVTVTDAREQTLRTVVDHLITRKQDYRDLFTTRDTFISPALAVIYHLASPPTWTPYEFPPDSPRAGLLTQISFLAVHSHPGRSSATRRGKALREVLLCQLVPRPPPNVDFSIVENPNSNLHTARERLTAHRVDPVCAGCHKITDPMGLTLESFDGAGQYRDTEKGSPIDTSGGLDGREVKDVVGLGQALHDHPALPSCLVKRVYSYGSGGATSPEDAPILNYFNARFAAQGYKLPDLLRTIALSNAFSEVVEGQDRLPSSVNPTSASSPQNGGEKLN